jgi:hypothetical protein
MLLSIVFAGLVFSPFANQSGDSAYAGLRGKVTTLGGYPSRNVRVVAYGDVDVHRMLELSAGLMYEVQLTPGCS